MKSIEEQIKFIDKVLLPLFGIKNIIDYESSINTDGDFDLAKINKIIPDFRNIFPVKNFNLHKTNYKIVSYDQAINLLKMCLNITNILYDLNKNTLKLINGNVILENYILKNYPYNLTKVYKFLGTKTEYNNEDLYKNIKKEHTYSVQINPKNYITSNIFKFDLKSFNLEQKNIRSVKITFTSKIIDTTYLNSILSELYYTFPVLKLTNKFKNNKELLPSKIIFFNTLNWFGSSQIEITNIEIISNILEFIECNIDFIYVDFKQSFYKNLKNATINQIIENNNLYNMFMLSEEKHFLKYENYMTKETFYNENKIPLIESQSSDENKTSSQDKIKILEEQNIFGKEIKYGNLIGYKIDEVSSGELKSWLTPLVLSYDFTTYICFEKIDLTAIYNTKGEQRYDHTFVRRYDSISKIELFFEQDVSVLDLKCKCVFLRDRTYYECILDIECKNSQIFVNSIDELHHLNIAGMMWTSMILSYSGDKKNIYNNMKIKSTTSMWSRDVRQKLSDLNIIVDIDDLEK